MSVTNKKTDDVKQQLASRAELYATHVKQAVSSLAWFHPIQGILYSVRNPDLYAHLGPALGKAGVASGAVVIALFFFTYLPQTAFLALISGPLSPILAVPLVLSESALLLSLLARPLFLDPALTDLFDNVLLKKGHVDLVARGRQLRGKSGGRGREIGKALVRPLEGIRLSAVLRYLISLPLNAVPVVGTLFFLVYNGSRNGPGWHARYFQLKGFTKQQREKFVAERAPAYTAFGTSALLLQMIPLGGLISLFTTTVGAALWAAEMEASGEAPNGEGKTE